MTIPKISIIVPVYNTEKYLSNCVESIRNQSLKDIEIILVDDGSKKICADLCDELAEKDARIKVVHKENGGAGIARNAGMAVATGKYLGFVDSDDFVSPAMYQALYNTAEEHSADLVLSGVRSVSESATSEENGEEKNYFDKVTLFEKEDIKNLLLGVVGARPNEPDDSRYGVSIWKNIYKTAIVRENNLEFSSERKILSEDTFFNVDFIKNAKKAVGIPGAFYCYRNNGTSISKSYDKDRLNKLLAFFDEIENRLSGTVEKDEYKLYVDRLTQGYVRVLCAHEIFHAQNEKNSFSHLRKRLKEICTQDRVKNALKSYPWYKLPVKQAVFAFAMKYKLYFLQKLLVILKGR